MGTRLGCRAGDWRNVEGLPHLPAISLWDFFDSYPYLIAQISSSIHGPICTSPQYHSITICIEVILILKKEKQDKKKKHTTCGEAP